MRSKAIPKISERYLAGIERQADRLPRTRTRHNAPARDAAAVAAMFFEAKHAKNVPQCFAGRFTFLNRTHDFGGAEKIDWRVDMDGGSYQLWRANLAFMGWLSPAFDSDPERALGFAETVIAGFREQARFQRSSDFADVWNSYPVAQRILTFSAILIRLPERYSARSERATIDAFLRLNVAYLLGNLETELGFNHLERNLSALALYALAAGTVPPAIEAALHRHFPHVVGETFGEDGAQLERSAMYQALCIQSLRILSALDIWSDAQAALLHRRLTGAEAALAALTLGDDRPIMMNDAWFDETPRTSAVLNGAPTPGFVALEDAGYVRLADGDVAMVFDAGPIGPDANPGHGHADFLSVELSLGADRLIVDPGTTHYAPDRQRDTERSWHAHNGPTIADGRPVEYLGSFKVGRRTAATLDGHGENGAGQWAEGSLSFDGATVRRRVSLSNDCTITLRDSWHGGAGWQSRLLVPDDWQVEASDTTQIRFIRGDRTVVFSVEGGSLSLAPASWTCRYNATSAAHAVTLTPAGDSAALIIRTR
ncbi:heparinase II/III family protein [Stakelama pacifica]|uniref:Heparinase II/III-like protein n=1 Tax=Stakelama pacifica TaxID=517720 RepID=A0A4R6FIG5_9SPHN|nr:heparinase II/III-family protein [Stakelama pacifica]TDN81229.1 heparinase II/III-like protein [Stakelama pacifica]GGO97129.1 hypothetical protein GCM10011329_25260 [Stakelama pacifica]